MTALIGQARFDAVRRQAEVMDTDPRRPTRIFVPVGPAPDSREKLRILFVGQSGYEWDDGSEPTEQDRGASFNELSERQAASLGKLLSASQSPFWQAVRLIVERVLRSVGSSEIVEEKRWTDAVGWSNLLKIHRRQSGTNNPDSEFAEQQRSACAASLREEVENAYPTAVVLLTGGTFAIDIVRDVFGPDKDWFQNDRESSHVAIQWRSRLGVPVLWGNHPHQMRLDKSWSEDLGFIAGCVAAFHGRSVP